MIFSSEPFEDNASLFLMRKKMSVFVIVPLLDLFYISDFEIVFVFRVLKFNNSVSECVFFIPCLGFAVTPDS